jgi:hypothetical protein
MDHAMLLAVKLFDEPGGDEKGDFDAFFEGRLANGFRPLGQGGSVWSRASTILASYKL